MKTKTPKLAPVSNSLDSDPARTGASVNMVADGLAAMLETQGQYAAGIAAAILALDDATTANKAHFLTVFHYFDVGTSPAYKSVDNHVNMDAAIMVLYKVAEGDKDALKRARDVNTYRRKVGAQFAGAALRGTGAVSTAAVKSEAAKVTDYLASHFGKCTLAEQNSIIGAMTAAYNAAVNAAQREADLSEYGQTVKVAKAA
jgi:hypothetical protein